MSDADQISYPLQNQGILVGREVRQADRFCQLILQRQARPVPLPLLRLQENQDADQWSRVLKELPRYDWLVFTSENAPRLWERQLRLRGLRLDSLFQGRFAVVGPTTLEALALFGVQHALMPEQFHGRALAQTLLEQIRPGQRILIPRSVQGDPELVLRLQQAGALVWDFGLYQTLPENRFYGQLRQELQRGNVNWLAFTSSSMVESFCQGIGEQKELLKDLQVASIGPKTTETLQKNKMTIQAQAQVSTLDGMLDAMEVIMRAGGLL